jgi:2,4-dienoyl-CoA reductase-like NADH-dependent reductase (Old Yellow Enzyme family)
MSKLFENNILAGIKLRNRFVRSATWEGLAEDTGLVSESLVELMRELAEGEVGLILSSHAYVAADGQAGNRQLAIDRDECISGISRMAHAVHQGGGKLAIQLAHAGKASRVCDSGQCGPNVVDKAWIARTVEAFAAAAFRAEKAGCDGVQIHAAHGYLLSSFLSPFYNQRDDEYGGSVENRARIVIEVLKAIKDVVGSEFPVMIKMNSEDFVGGGLTVPDMLRTAAMLSLYGINAIELSGGILEGPKELNPIRNVNPGSIAEEGYYLEAAKQFKTSINVPLILVGGFRSIEACEQAVDNNFTDYISLSRPLIREPALVARWHSGDRQKASCISCNACFRPALSGRGIYCVPAQRLQAK